MPKHIYALLVGIDKYPIERHRLSGCVNDVNNLKTYLQTHFPLNVQVLLDSEATRQNIIHGFRHFDQAQTGDICLFHFSGHGAQSEPPPGLWHLESDRKVESIVCYDSRLEGGSDLIDKELSYLIYKATQGKDTHFVAIMDCCHAGTNTRYQSKKVRMVETAELLRPIEEYLGFTEYEQVEPRKFRPPQGRHIQLAAAKANELANEIFIEYQNRGAFSYALLDTLQKNGNALSYAELIERVNVRVRNLVRNQSPQIEAIQVADQALGFLTGELTSPFSNYLLTYDTELGWVLNVGILHGLQIGNVLECQENQRELVISEVLPTRAKINGNFKDFDRFETYNVCITKRQLIKTTLAFGAAADPTAVATFETLFKKQGSALLDLVNTSASAQLHLHTRSQNYQLTLPDDERPIFIPVPGWHEAAATDFLNKLERVAKWQRLLEFDNPATSIPAQALEWTSWRLTQAGNYEDNTLAEEMNHPKSIELPYLFDHGKWQEPAFRLKLRNTSSRTLWVSALYLGEDFSIQNELLPKVELEAGDEVWLTQSAGDFIFRSILTKIDDRLWKRGITQSLEFIKIIVSTEELKTDHFNQKGFYDQPLSPTRALVQRGDLPKPDWRTYLLPIRTTRPLSWQTIRAEQPFHAFGIRIEAPVGFQGQVRLANMEEIELAMPAEFNSRLADDQIFTPFEFCDGLNYTPGLSVIEFFETPTGVLEAPLKITFSAELNHNIHPLRYDLQHKCFVPLAALIIGKELYMKELPEASSSFYNYYTSKIFLNNSNMGKI